MQNRPEYDFSGSVAFITGAARGQGREHAVRFAESGADVVLLDVCETPAESQYEFGSREELTETAELVDSAGGEALEVVADVTDEPAVAAAVERAEEAFDEIDVLSAGAGMWDAAHAVDIPVDRWDRMIDINLKGVWLATKHVGKHMIEHETEGAIVNTTSTLGMVGSPGYAHYAAAKAGVMGLTKTTALEFAEYNINVNAIAPSVVDTDMTQAAMDVGGDILQESADIAGPWNVFDPVNLPMLEAADITEAVMWLASDASRYVTGITLPVDAGCVAK